MDLQQDPVSMCRTEKSREDRGRANTATNSAIDVLFSKSFTQKSPAYLNCPGAM